MATSPCPEAGWTCSQVALVVADHAHSGDVRTSASIWPPKALIDVGTPITSVWHFAEVGPIVSEVLAPLQYAHVTLNNSTDARRSCFPTGAR